MGYKKPTETTKAYLENAPLPNHGKSYTVISHKQVIDNTLQMLNQSGFTVEKELYRANANAQVAQGIFHIKPNNTSDTQILEEEELGMMFAWTNSYDKSVRFQCAIGGYVQVCYNGMVCGDMMTFARKHTGSADHEIKMQISNQIKNAEKYFKRILDDRDALRGLPLTKRQQSELLGRLYFDENVLEASQLTCIKSEMEEPSYDYKCDQENAWTFYNHVTHGLKKAHPRNWLSDTKNFHDFITADLLGNMGIHKTDSIDLSKYETSNDSTMIEVDFEDAHVETVDEVITSSMEHQLSYLGRS